MTVYIGIDPWKDNRSGAHIHCYFYKIHTKIVGTIPLPGMLIQKFPD